MEDWILEDELWEEEITEDEEEIEHYCENCGTQDPLELFPEENICFICHHNLNWEDPWKADWMPPDTGCLICSQSTSRGLYCGPLGEVCDHALHVLAKNAEFPHK